MQLPEAFITRTKKLLGDEWPAFEKALNSESPISIRLNPKKTSPRLLSDALSLSEPVPWATGGYYLNSRPSFTFDPLFHAGCYYVQEASSMIIEYFVRKYFPQPAKVLDLCAAPGGKSTHLSSLLPEDCLLVANEIIRSRACILSENLIKWGNYNTFVTCNNPSEIGKSLPEFFDAIVADLPCSGEGMFRKDPDAIKEWSVNNVRLCAGRQRRIIADIWPALKSDGILIYSTCTYNREENEENIDWICRELDAELLEDPRRLMPHSNKGEGFFIAGIKKKEGDFSGGIAGLHCAASATTKHNRTAKGRNERKNGKGAGVNVFRSSPFTFYLSTPNDFTYISDKDNLIAVPVTHLKDYLEIKSNLKIISSGVILGEMKGKDLIPAHGLAMSNALSKTAFPIWEVDKETALFYLRKDDLQNIPKELPMGYTLIAYKGHPLGFIKNIGRRVNNLYPQRWRIRMKCL